MRMQKKKQDITRKKKQQNQEIYEIVEISSLREKKCMIPCHVTF